MFSESFVENILQGFPDLHDYCCHFYPQAEEQRVLNQHVVSQMSRGFHGLSCDPSNGPYSSAREIARTSVLG